MNENQLLKSFLVMLVMYTIDSCITYFLPYNLTKTGLSIIPCLGLMMFILLVDQLHEKAERFFFAAVCGLYYCICYADGLVIYTLFYCLIAFVRTYIYKVKKISFIEFLIFSSLTIIARDIVVYWLMKMTSSTFLSISNLILHRILPTLGLNFLLGFVAYFIYIKFKLEDTQNEY